MEKKNTEEQRTETGSGSYSVTWRAPASTVFFAVSTPTPRTPINSTCLSESRGGGEKEQKEGEKGRRAVRAARRGQRFR